MTNFVEKGRRVTEFFGSMFGNSRKETGFDPDLILQEITSTEEMRYYLNARSFWRSKEGRQIIKGRYIECPSLTLFHKVLPSAQDAYKLRSSIPKTPIPSITEIQYADQLRRGLAEALYEKGMIPRKDSNGPSFAQWYSRYLPVEDRSIYEGYGFDGTPKSWDKFVEVDISLTLAFLEFTRVHPETLTKD